MASFCIHSTSSTSRIHWLFLGFSFFFSSLGYYASAQVVSGQVISATDQQPLPGVNVLMKGTTIGTVTDLDGNYRLDTTGEDTLTFSYIGFVSQQVPVNGRSVVDVTLAEDVENLVRSGGGRLRHPAEARPHRGGVVAAG